jgi:uncharacterized protein YegP (UPF0339 family)
MAIATQKAHATTDATGVAPASETLPMEFLIVEDNSGEHHWTLLDSDGNRLARSPSYASFKPAEEAARAVRASAGSAQPPRATR